MTQSAPSAQAGSFRFWVVFAVFVLFLLIAVSSSSFWIDEVGTAKKAGQPTIGDWWHLISTDKETDLQMPFYSLYLWVAAKSIGLRELPLRLASAVWLLPGLVAFVLSFRSRHTQITAMLVALTNAFLWYYANEARSYAMQLGGSLMVFAAIHRLAGENVSDEQQKPWLRTFAAGLLILCGSSMLCMIWASSALAAIWLLFPSSQLLAWFRRNRALWISLVVSLAILGGFYVWTVSLGSRGSGAGVTNWKTTLFVIYDQCGFSGLGPGRTELRADGIAALRPFAPRLAAFAIALGILVFTALLHFWRQNPRQTAAIAVAIISPWLFLSIVGLAAHFRLLGRHCAPLTCVWLFLASTGLSLLTSLPGWFGKAISAAFLALALTSSLSIRFSYRQAKDDYRRAASVASTALRAHQTVWWNADKDGALYYSLPISESLPVPNKVLLIFNPSDTNQLTALPQPDIVVASKPDLFDFSGALASYLIGHRFRVIDSFPAFQVWQAPQAR